MRATVTKRLTTFAALALAPALWTGGLNVLVASSPPSPVRTDPDAKKILRHFESRYEPTDVVHSFRTDFGDEVDCIPMAAQAVIRNGLAEAQREPKNPVLVYSVTAGDPRGERVHFGFGGYDREGRLRECPDETVALKKYRRQDLLGFETLDDLFSKYPKGTPASPVLGPNESHQYAGGVCCFEQNHGLGAAIEVWKPWVERSDEFSLAQLSAARGSGNDLQTVETGWQVYRQKYGDWNPHFFIYSTTGNYAPGTGCYNNECGNFYQNPGTFCLGCRIGPVSTPGTQIYFVNLDIFKDLDNGSWWIRMWDSWIGFYPRTNFDAAGLETMADRASWFGEVVDQSNATVHTNTDMGSGYFPVFGPGWAARYWGLHWIERGTLIPRTPALSTFDTPGCYHAFFSDPGPSWEQTTLLYGGDGKNPLCE